MIPAEQALLAAQHEIWRLRQENQILRAKVDTMELLGALFKMAPPGGGGMAPDIIQSLQQAIEDEKARNRQWTLDVERIRELEEEVQRLKPSDEQLLQEPDISGEDA